MIADQARMRRDLTVLRADDEHAIELRVLTNRRADINSDRTRRINRLRGQLTSIFPSMTSIRTMCWQVRHQFSSTTVVAMPDSDISIVPDLAITRWLMRVEGPTSPACSDRTTRQRE